MTREKWNTLSPQERRDAVLKHDTSGMMAQPQWAPLLQDMTRPWDQLTSVQQMAVKDIKL